MNKAILMGRLTRDPEIRTSQTAQGEDLKIVRYTLAVDRPKKQEGQQSADFISCVGFGHAAEFAEKYLRQGTKILASGRIQTGSYTNKEGVKVYTTEIVLESQEFAESKKAGENQETGGADDDGFMQVDTNKDDLPFK